MKKKLLLLLIMLFCAGIARAEYFYLSNGEVIHGKIVAETNSTITVAVGGKRHKVNVTDIVDITTKPKPVVEPVKQSATPEEAKTQFSSQAKQEMKGAETYVSDNQSGLVVYNVKQADVEPPVQQSFTPVSSSEAEVLPVVSETKPAAPANDNFDAASYLLGGGGSNSEVKTNTDNDQNQATQSPVSETTAVATASSSDDDYDPALYLLGIQSANFQEEEKEPQPLIAKPEEESADTEEKDEYAVPPVDEKKEKAMLRETFVGISFDLKGSNKFSGSEVINSIPSKLGKEDSDYGFSLAVEHYGYLNNYFAIGAGAGYEFFRSLESTPGKFSFLPLYLSVKIRPYKTEEYSIYAVIQGGYNFLIANHSYLGQASAKGGFYYAGGIGASVNNYVIQLLYSVNNASLSYSSNVTKIDKDVSFSKLGIYFGYLF